MKKELDNIYIITRVCVQLTMLYFYITILSSKIINCRKKKRFIYIYNMLLTGKKYKKKSNVQNRVNQPTLLYIGVYHTNILYGSV